MSAPKPALGNPGTQDISETQEPTNDPAKPLPGLEEKTTNICASEGVYLKQLPHPTPLLQADCTRQSSAQERETEGPELKSDASETADNYKTSKSKNAWPLDSSYTRPAGLGCMRDLSVAADRGNLPAHGSLVKHLLGDQRGRVLVEVAQKSHSAPEVKHYRRPCHVQDRMQLHLLAQTRG